MKIIKYASLLLMVSLVGCGHEYKEVTANEFKNRLEESGQNTIDSWDYYGEDDNYYYFVKSDSVAREFYKVPLDQIEIAHQFKYSSQKSVNLKNWHVKFNKN